MFRGIYLKLAILSVLLFFGLNGLFNAKLLADEQRNDVPERFITKTSSQDVTKAYPSLNAGNPVQTSTLNVTAYQPDADYITVISPNGGDTLCSLSDHEISWTTDLTDTVWIQYSIDSGSSWIMIDSCLASAESYSWYVQNMQRANCLIKICNKDESICDESDSLFAILHAPFSPMLAWPAQGCEDVRIDPTYFDWHDTTFDWPDTTEGVFYRLQVDDDPNFYTPEYDSSEITSTNQNVRGLSPGVTYYWQVYAYTACSTSKWSDMWPFTTSDRTQSIRSQDWQGGWDYWYQVGDLWELGYPTSGPGEPYSGDACVGTDLDSDYPAHATAQLSSPWILLPKLDRGESLDLRFWHWFDIDEYEGPYGDWGLLKIMLPSSEYRQLADTFSGSSSVWTPVRIDLSAYAESTVRIDFIFRSYASYEKSGWYADDIGITKSVPIFNNPEDWECGIGDWWVDNGVWEVGAPTSGPGDRPLGRCAATVLGGVYPPNAHTRLISPDIDFSALGLDCDPKLRFLHWFTIETNDKACLQISVNDGEWKELHEPFLGSTLDEWIPVQVDLSPYADSTVRIGFYFYSDGSDERDGWYVDSIQILETPETPKIVWFSPADQESVSYNCSIAVKFSSKIDPSTVDSNGVSITGRKDYEYKWSSHTEDSLTFTFSSDSGFYSLDTVEVTLTDSIKDVYGHSICGNTSWIFYVYPLGDYNQDMVVNGDDLADFTIAWNTQDTSKEIGPATGVAPRLLCHPDGKVDFEDLVIFVWMWNSFHQGPSLSPPICPEYQTTDSDNLIAFTPDSSIGQNESKQFGLVLKDVKEVMVVSLVFEYDPAQLQIESINEGFLLSKNGAKTLFLKSIDNHRGVAEVVSSRLNGDPLGVDGTEPVARIRVKALTRISSEPLAVHYKVWNSQAKPLVIGHSLLKLNFADFFPQGLELFQNYPNPFNPQTTIRYNLPQGSQVRLTIYNIAGQKVKTLVEEHQTAGHNAVRWNGTDDNGSEVTSGIYFYRIQAGEFTQTKKMVILK